MKRVGDLVEPFVPCVNCTDGWVKASSATQPWANPKVEGVDYMTRCSCWIAHQQRVLDALQQQGKKKKT
jgi:hypothetical protein